MKMWGKAAMAVAAVALLAGCSKSGMDMGTINLKIGAQTYSTHDITVEKGKMYKLVVENTDAVLHDFSVDKIEVTKGHAAGEGHHDMDMGGMADPDLHLAVDAGKTATLEFTPTKAGTYTFYCTVPGHKDAGMKGTLTVK
jgi:uncharacterized cupredoxin-like copper-binding protein